MAVNITVAALASAIRVGDSAEETAQVARLLEYATTTIARHLGDEYAVTPEAIVNEAVVRIVGYLFDQPTASRGAAFSNSLRNSGAARMLLPYVIHRAGAVPNGAATADPLPADTGGGLRQIGSETLTVATTYEWIATALPAPQTDIAGVSVIAPDGSETGIQLFRAAQLTGSAVAGGDATADLDRMFALETAADGTVLFASKEAGAHTIFLYEVP